MDELPEGYSLIDPVHPQSVQGGLRLGSLGVLQTGGGCWHARQRNTVRAFGEPRWRWIFEIDPGAVQRYRRRAWTAATGNPPSADPFVIESNDSSYSEASCYGPGELWRVDLQDRFHWTENCSDRVRVIAMIDAYEAGALDAAEIKRRQENYEKKHGSAWREIVKGTAS